tara:strand:+ start:267 stop:659 length:393 start_codon:yes stop_codon:yes gene_type:complete
MANDENLIPITSTKRARELGSRGGRNKSPKKQWAARLREMKKKGLTDENYKRIVAWMEEPESSAMDIFLYLESVKKHCNNASQMNNVAQSQISLMKAHHGEKHKAEVVHHVINWSDMFKDAEIRPKKDSK